MSKQQRAIAMRSRLGGNKPVPVPQGRSIKSYVSRVLSNFGLTNIGSWQNVVGGSGGWSTQIGGMEAAMQLSAVFAAVRRYGETIGSLPMHMYQWTSNGPVRIEDSDSSEILTARPNDEQTPMEFWEGMQASVDLTGDAIAIKTMIGDRCIGMRMVDPRPPATKIEKDRDTKRVRYFISEDGEAHREYAASEIFHIRGFSVGGIRGLSPVEVGARSLGLAMNADRSAQNVFKNGLRVSGFLETGRVLDQETRPRVEEMLEKYMGGQNAGGVMVLEGGMTFNKVGINPIDAELLTTRKFSVEEIGRWFDMPPILLGHAVEGQTMWGSGVDAIVQSWMTLGLRQRLIRIQQSAGARVLTPRERARGIYLRFNPDALLAVASTARIQVLSQSVQNSLMKVNEARSKLDLPAVPGGDVPLAQVNLVPLDQLGENEGSDSRVRSMLQNWLMPNPGDPNAQTS